MTPNKQIILVVEDWDLKCPGAGEKALPERFALLPDSWSSYSVHDAVPLADLEEGIVVDTKARRIWIKTSPAAGNPVSYFVSKGLVVLAASPGGVAEELARRGRSPKPDRIGILESMFFDHTPLARTCHEGISKTRMGGLVEIFPDEGRHVCQRHWKLALYAQRDAGNKELSDEGHDLIKDLFKDAPRERSYLALSGGLDSRMIAGFAREGQDLYEAFSYSSFGSADARLARRVAQQAEIEWRMLPLRPSDYLRYGYQIVDQTGGLVSGMHMHLLSCVDRLPKSLGCLTVGQLGEHAAGDHASPLDESMGLQKSIERYVSKNVAPNPLWDVISSTDRDAIMADISETAEECAESNPPCCFDEYVGCTERQSGLIAYIFSVLSGKFKLFRPFVNSHYVEFFSSLPPELRINRRLFNEVGQHLFPDLFDLPSTAAPLGRCIPLKLQRAYMRARNVVQYASAALTRDRCVLFSPFIYEQRSYILRTTLRPHVIRAIECVSELLGTDLQHQRAMIGRRGSVSSLFRTLAVARVFCPNELPDSDE